MSRAGVTDWLVYHASYWSAFWAFTLGWGVRAGGRHRVPRTGPALIVCNHTSHLDPPLVGVVSPRPLTYLARSTLFGTGPVRGPFTALIRSLGAVPIDREVGTEGIKAVFQALADGRAVIMFPEGTRTEDGAIQPLKPGVSLLVKRADCPIVPCGIAGGFEAWPRKQVLPVPAPLGVVGRERAIAVHFGEPMPPGHYRSMPREDILTDLHQRIAAAKAAAEKMRY
jgi:1-acyl-sn-glycerol-3-phosphate acyltransferase